MYCLCAWNRITRMAGKFFNLIKKFILNIKIVELNEFNSVHEHGIFYDCIHSELISLKEIRNKETNKELILQNKIESKTDKHTKQSDLKKKCILKYENSASSFIWTLKMAIEEGDSKAREMLYHRFLRMF